MPAPPTAKPLTVKEFDVAVSGVCGGCSASCGYIAYLKGRTLVDLYGHPHDPNGIGSFCTKGMTYIQQLLINPLRIRKPLLKTEEGFREIAFEELEDLLKDFLRGKVAVFLDRYSGIEEYLIVRQITPDIFSDSLYLPFKTTSVRPQDWANKKAILIFECEPTFSEVMLTRWIVDAFEKDAFILSVGSRFTTVYQKSSESVIVPPHETISILESIAEGIYEGKIIKLLELLGEESQIIIGDTLLRSPFRNRVLNAVKRIRERYGSDYSFVGNLSPFELKDLEEFLDRLEEFDTFILFGNPFIYLRDLEKLKGKNIVNFTYFPTITANNSTLIIPRTTFAEREFINKGLGFLTYSPKVIPTEIPQPHELLSKITGFKPNPEEFLENFGVSLKDLITAEGGIEIKGKDIREFSFDPEELIEPKLWLICDNTLTEDLGHWNTWTHALEREQFAYVSVETKEKFNFGEEIDINGVKLPVKVNNNLAKGVIFVPNSFEEYQPFESGVRVGRLMKKPFFKLEEYLL